MKDLSRKRGYSGATAIACLVGIAFLYSPMVVFADKATAEAVSQAEDAISSSTIASIAELASRLRLEQTFYRTIMPPDADFTLQQPCGIVVFDPKTFPDSFNENLIGEKTYDSPVYTLLIAEDPSTREIVIANADGKEIACIKPEADYDPDWFLNAQFPDIYSGLYSQDVINELRLACDPARIQITITLLPVGYVKIYATAKADEKAKLAAEQAAAELLNPTLKKSGGIGMMKFQGSGLTNFFMDIASVTNGMMVTLAYPDDYTNRVDFYTCSDLVGGWWDLAVDSTNANTSTNFIQWVDSNVSAHSVRFYNVGNAGLDSDGDGISDAREKLMYHTNSATNDTDGDGLLDGYELFTSHTDPNNGDTNKPNVWISFPAAGTVEVWEP